MNVFKLIALTLPLVIGAPSWAQIGGRPGEAPQEIRAPDLAEGVLRAIEAEYLNDEERAALRVFHGVWREGDLENPVARGEAALAAGVFDDPALEAESGARPEARAQAAIRRGEPGAALTLLEGVDSPRGLRVRAEALEMLGRFEQANRAIDPLVTRLLDDPQADAATLTEGVAALIVRARLEGRPAGDYQAMTKILARAHQELDRLYWPAKLVEAELLYDKDNRAEAYQAATEVLALNGACADAWMILGRLAVDSFDFGTAERIADRLRRLRARFTESGGTHPQGDLLLANAWLRQNDPDLAQQQIAPVLARFPAHRQALALRAAAEAIRYDFSIVERQLAEFDTLSPGSPLAIFTVGRALAENRQYGPAAEYLRRAVERQPNWAAPVTELGLLEMQSGRDAEALAALRRSTELDPFNIRARNSLKLLEELAAWSFAEGEHFRVRYKPGVDEAVARDMVPVLDEIHRRVAAEFEHAPPSKTLVELMPNHEMFAVRITGMPGIHTVAAATGPLIAMEAPREGKGHNGLYDWARVVQHEYTHTVTLSLTNNRIPHWFTEAAAVHMERAPRDFETCQLLVGALRAGELFDMRKINLAFVRPEKPTDRSQAYAQGHWMYQYVVHRWGRAAPIELMKRYGAGMRQPEAMREVLGIEEDQFLADFLVWAAEDASSWGMWPTPSLDALRLQATLADENAQPKAVDALARFASSAACRLAGGAGPVRYAVPLVEPTPPRVAKWIEAHPDHPDLLELRVREVIEAAGGRAVLAHVPLLLRYAQARPVDPMPHRELARLYLTSADPSQAIPHLQFLDVREQNSSAYAAELARLLREQGAIPEAFAKAERAVQIGPYVAGPRESAAALAIQVGDLRAAERHIMALVALEPEYKKHQQRLEAIRRLLADQPAPPPGG